MRKVIKLQMELWKNISQNQFGLKSRDEIPKLLMGYNSTYTAPQKIVPSHASTDVSCLPFFLSAALRLQLHSRAIRLQAPIGKKKNTTQPHVI